MSAYCFGKIVTDVKPEVVKKIQHLADSADIEVTLGLHELDDQEILEESDYLKGEGVIFNVFTPGDYDITKACNEALVAGCNAIRGILGDKSLPHSWKQVQNIEYPDQVYEAVLRTRIGKFIAGLYNVAEAKSIGLAIFDNGIDQVIEGTASTTKAMLLRSLLVPWDLGPHALFAWK